MTIVTIWELAGPRAPGDGSSDEIFRRARRGRSAIKRAAIVRASEFADGQSGSAAISVANLSMAVGPGSRDSLAASCQGSTSCRASAERTLSGIPFRCSAIGAKRNGSNSDPRPGIEAECVILATDLCRRCRTYATGIEACGTAIASSQGKSYSEAPCAVRLGNYLTRPPSSGDEVTGPRRDELDAGEAPT